MKTRSQIVVALVAMAALLPNASIADGIDLVSYFSRAPTNNLALAIPLAALLMLVNYGLNWLVVGMLAKRFGHLSSDQIRRPLVWFTLLGQVADRVGALAAALSCGIVANIIGLTGESTWATTLMPLNFIFSAMSIAALALVFSRGVWHLSMKHSLWISAAAGIFTNPAWAIAIWFL